jgi:ATP-dependent protease ClpP protease subunit
VGSGKARFFRLNKNIDETIFNRFKAFVEKYEESDDELVVIFDSNGGNMLYAANIINLMNESKHKFYGLAYGKVHSAAIAIFLSTHVRFGYSKATSLIHRARPLINSDTTYEELLMAEKQILEFIAEKLQIELCDVQKMAEGEGTYITMEHPYGKKFFIGN